MPTADQIYECYDILEEPAKVKKPVDPTPMEPSKPAPPAAPVEPGDFDPSEYYDDKVQSAREYHLLVEQAYSQQKEMHDKKISYDWLTHANETSPEWVQYFADAQDMRQKLIANNEKARAYDAYKNHQEERRVNAIVAPWRYGTYTPALSSAGCDLFGKAKRAKHFPDAIVSFSKNGEEEKFLMCIPEETEAFGLLQYENCRDRWQAIFEYEAKHKTKAPTYNPTKPGTNAFKAKWSDDCQGSGSGWNPDAFVALGEWEGKIKTWREDEVKKYKYKRWSAAQAASKEIEDGGEDEDSEEEDE